MNDIHDIARQVAANLGGQYQEDGEHRHYAEIRLIEGRGIRLRIDRGRIRISGVYPDPVHGPAVTRNFAPTRGVVITCAHDKPPGRIANEILRRFLPKYEPLYAEQVKARQRYVTRLAREAEILQLLAKASGGSLSRDRVHLPLIGKFMPSASFEVHTTGGITTVEFSIRNAPVEVALRIATVLADARTQQGEQ